MEDIASLVIEICAMCGTLPPKTAAMCALVSRQFNASVQWYLYKLDNTHSKYIRKFGKALYTRLLKYPFVPDKIIPTIRKIHPNGLFGYVNEDDKYMLFRMKLYKNPFSAVFLEKNIVAISNVKLRLVAPVDIKYEFIYIAHKLESGYASADRFVPVDCGGTTRYLLDLKLGTRYNPLLSNYIDIGRLYLDVYADILDEPPDNKLIVEYYVYSKDKYKYDEYYPCYDGNPRFIKKCSFIRHQSIPVDESSPEPEPSDVYDRLDTFSIYMSSTGHL